MVNDSINVDQELELDRDGVGDPVLEPGGHHQGGHLLQQRRRPGTVVLAQQALYLQQFVVEAVLGQDLLYFLDIATKLFYQNFYLFVGELCLSSPPLLSARNSPSK